MRERVHVLTSDVAYGLRLMRTHPLTTAAAILTIALGIGANTAMFSVVNAVLLRLPFDDADRIVSVLRQTPRGESAGIPVTQFRAWPDGTPAVESLAGYTMASPVLTGVGEPDRLRLECISASMFRTLGVRAAHGRTFSPLEDRSGAEGVLVVSDMFWTERLGRDPRAIGRALVLDGVPVIVIGVMPRAFDGPRALRRLDGWLPLSFCLDDRSSVRGAGSINVFARLKSGASPRLAEEQLEAIALQPPGRSQDRVRVHLVPLTDQIYGDVKEPLLALAGAAGFLLVLACANVASLLLGRVEARRAEIAMRTVLGCSRRRLLQQMLTESVLLALFGGAAGLIMSKLCLSTVVALMPWYIRRIDHIALDGDVLIACVALSIATGVLVGLFPALNASRQDLGAALKEASHLGTPRRRWLRGALIVAEIALSVALLTGAGLLMRTFLHLRPSDPGFDPQHKVTATVVLPRDRYATGPDLTTFVENLRERLLQRPGVETVVAASYLPLSGSVSTAEVQLAGAHPSPPLEIYAPHVTPGYFQEMNIPILRGRAFTASDRAGTNVAIVNETLALRMWPREDPLGRQIVFKSVGPGTTASAKTIVGIARNVRDSGNRLTAAPAVYVPFADEPVTTIRFVVTTLLTPEQMSPIIRQEVAAIDPILPVAGDIESLERIVARSVSTWRFAATLMSVFAGIAMLLAAVGLFAVVGSWVTERTAEIGVRMALGANRTRVLGLFLGRSALLTALGASCGLALAAITSRYLAAWLVNISPVDRVSFAAAATAMSAICLLATLLAARHATTIDPVTALRSS